ncbi:MAG TPA: hypothetical protein VNQ90_00040 [Chthoniobacteraceae bacterium]|nr:hypothetical protein [Chthoniobacteraceae bacterium]
MNIDHLIETCVPGGALCDPQVVADNIRRYFAESDPFREIREELKYSLQELDRVTAVYNDAADSIGCAEHAIRRAMDMITESIHSKDVKTFHERWGDQEWIVPPSALVFHRVHGKWIPAKGIGKPSGRGILYRIPFTKAEGKEQP